MRGIHLWKIQRLTALINIITIAYILSVFFQPKSLNYLQWTMSFSPMPVRFALTFSLMSFCKHAFIGVWGILTDYVKGTVLRQLLLVVFLFLFILTALLILSALWSLS